jgi:hypothetical protein
MLTSPRPTTQPARDPDVEAWVIKDARRRQRRQQRIVGLVSAVAAIGALILWFSGGGGGVATPKDDAHLAAHRIHVGALTVSLPTGWQQVVERGHYRSCTNPIIRLDLASHRLPAGFGKHEGAIVVRADGILLSILSAPIRSTARPWRQWRLSEHQLLPARTVGPNHYATEVNLPSSPAIGATVWLGSIPAPHAALAAANRILRSLRVDRTYSCQ